MVRESENEKDKVVSVGLFLGSGLWIVNMIIAGINWQKLPPQMPFFYSLPRGEQQLIEKGWFVGVIVMAGLIFLGNVILAMKLGKNEDLLKRFLIWGGVVVLMLLLMTTVRIMMIL